MKNNPADNKPEVPNTDAPNPEVPNLEVPSADVPSPESPVSDVPSPEVPNPLEPAQPPASAPMPESPQPPTAMTTPMTPEPPAYQPLQQQPQQPTPSPAPQQPAPQQPAQPQAYQPGQPQQPAQPQAAPQQPQYQPFPQQGQQPGQQAGSGGGQPPTYPGQQQQYGGGQPPAGGAQQKTNVLAIISLISAFFFSLLAVILGHISLSQIKKTGEKGRGLALTGTILGYVGVVIGAIVTISLIVGASIFTNELDNLDWDDEFFDSSDIWEDEDFDNSDFDDSDFDDFFADSDYEDPWVGTPHEAFCDALMNMDEDADNPFAAATAVAPAEFKAEFEKGSKAFQAVLDDEGDFDEAYEDLQDFMGTTLNDAFDFCFDF